MERPKVHVRDYKVQLTQGSKDIIAGHIQLDGANAPEQVELTNPFFPASGPVTGSF